MLIGGHELGRLAPARFPEIVIRNGGHLFDGGCLGISLIGCLGISPIGCLGISLIRSLSRLGEFIRLHSKAGQRGG